MENRLAIAEGAKTAAPNSSEAGSNLGTLLHVAWLAIVLGMIIEIVLVVLAAGFGGIPGIKSIVADLIQKVSWSVIVCVGLALGKVASKAQSTFMGLAGLFAAPLAFNVARTLHKSASYALKLAEPGAGLVAPFLLASLKGLEYAALGVLLGWVAKKSSAGVMSHAGAGLIVGLIFGSAIVSIPYGFATELMPVDKVLPQFINELIFPVGCSLALFTADVIGKRVAQ